jgi:hypothetical protein
MSESIIDLVDGLPTDSVTVKVLEILDFAVPGGWQNLVGFDRSIEVLTGVTDAQNLAKIRDKSVALYNDNNYGYQTAIWLYRAVDNTDKAIAAATIADKVGDVFHFIPFLKNLTPKAESLQSFDFGLKLLAEVLAYSKINGLTIDPKKFANSLSQTYGDEALVRMIALVSLDGILPLGKEFVSKIRDNLTSGMMSGMVNDPNLSKLAQVVPAGEQQELINESFKATEDWMTQIAKSIGSRDFVVNKLGNFIEIADDKLDYLAAFVDATVNYFEHTGIQTVARSLIKRAHQELQS